jgi:hypothetical protein
MGRFPPMDDGQREASLSGRGQDRRASDSRRLAQGVRRASRHLGRADWLALNNAKWREISRDSNSNSSAVTELPEC